MHFDLTPHILIQLSGISSESIGVSDTNPNIPTFYKYVANFTSTEQQQYIYCFNEFTSDTPSYSTFAIHENCQLAPLQAELREPGEKRYKMAHHIQYQMKLNRHIRPRL